MITNFGTNEYFKQKNLEIQIPRDSFRKGFMLSVQLQGQLTVSFHMNIWSSKAEAKVFILSRTFSDYFNTFQ